MEIHKLILDKLKFKLEEVKAIGIIGIKVYIQLASQEIVRRTIEGHGDHIVSTEDSERYNVEIRDGNAITTVRVHYIPIHMGNEAIIKAESHYGQVISLKNEVWGKSMSYPVPSGVRAIDMVLSQPIPSYIVIYGKNTLITYSGQKRTCTFCSSEEHMLKNCPNNRATQKNATILPVPQFVNRSYSEVTKQTETTIPRAVINEGVTEKSRAEPNTSQEMFRESQDIISSFQVDTFPDNMVNRGDKEPTPKKPRKSWNEEMGHDQMENENSYDWPSNPRYNQDPLGLSRDAEKSATKNQSGDSDMESF
ncbi:unnamed protein product [Phaedon cochleariae]|uniref:CCHC-type domain-containing protein n=1 Tax=Phaedon cochleariae TaxID=80249 RepID=A0A9N9SED8_PHACE|nr:unnamed protein product [Phaedon cochleariae]